MSEATPQHLDEYRDLQTSPELNEKQKKILAKVLEILEKDPKLQEELAESFMKTYKKVLSNPEQVATFIDNIEAKMIAEVQSLRESNGGSLKSPESQRQARSIIHRYTHMNCTLLRETCTPETSLA